MPVRTVKTVSKEIIEKAKLRPLGLDESRTLKVSHRPWKTDPASFVYHDGKLYELVWNCGPHAISDEKNGKKNTLCNEMGVPIEYTKEELRTLKDAGYLVALHPQTFSKSCA